MKTLQAEEKAKKESHTKDTIAMFTTANFANNKEDFNESQSV